MRTGRTLLGVMAVTLLITGAAAAQRRAAGIVTTVSPNTLYAGIAAVSMMGRDGGAAAHELSATDLKARLDKNQSIIIVDARTDLNGQIIKGAIHVPLSKLEEWARTADKGAMVVTYCTCPHDEAAEAEVNKLREWGFENAFTLSGGLDAARKAGIEIAVPSE